jgi:hypothetical protein
MRAASPAAPASPASSPRATRRSWASATISISAKPTGTSTWIHQSRTGWRSVIMPVMREKATIAEPSQTMKAAVAATQRRPKPVSARRARPRARSERVSTATCSPPNCAAGAANITIATTSQPTALSIQTCGAPAK